MFSRPTDSAPKTKPTEGSVENRVAKPDREIAYRRVVAVHRNAPAPTDTFAIAADAATATAESDAESSLPEGSESTDDTNAPVAANAPVLDSDYDPDYESEAAAPALDPATDSALHPAFDTATDTVMTAAGSSTTTERSSTTSTLVCVPSLLSLPTLRS